MTKRSLSIVIAGSAIWAWPIVAQDRSVFSALDVADRVVLADGGTARGSLSPEDLIATGGRRVQVWRLEVSTGDRLQVDLRSGDFDPYLYVVGPGLGEGLTDDDSGDGLNARLCVAVEEPGEYRVVASSLSSATGGYTLQVAEREGVTSGACPEGEAETTGDTDDIALLSTDDRVLRVGAAFDGTLSTADPTVLGSPAQAWALEGPAGQSVSVDLISEDFDAYLMIQGPGLESWLQDDDGAGRCDSRVTLELPETGLYRVVASSLGEATGAYRLVVTQEPGPISDDACGAMADESAPARDVEAIALAGTLTWEQSLEGTLTGNEGRYDDRLMQAWAFEGEAGERVLIEVRSSDFDSYLYLTGPGFEDPIWNDDGAGNLNARLCVELPEDGTYRALAGAYSGGEAGNLYTIHTSRSADVEATCEGVFEISDLALASHLAGLPSEGRTLSLGRDAEGRIESDDPRHPDANHLIQAWGFQGEAGRTVYVDVVSDEFDAVLYAVGAGIDGILFIDDAGDGCNSRMAITPTESGPIVLLPGAYSEDRIGAFVIRASEDPPALEDGGCANAAAEPGTTDATALDGISSGLERPIELATVVTGSLGPDDERLASGAPAQAWTMLVRAGEEIEITLASETFDPVLYLDAPSISPPLMDDDSAGDLDSRIVYTSAEDALLRFVVSAYSSEAGGDFELSVVVRRVP